MSNVACIECLDKGSYWTEGSPDVAERIGLTVLNDGSKDPDGTILIQCPHCLPPQCSVCKAFAAMNCSIVGCPN